MDPVGPSNLPTTKYARSGSLHLAYQRFGDGDADIVIVPGFVSHVEVCWEHTPYRRFMDRLGSFAGVTVYDKRGSGLSDPVEGEVSFDHRLDDLQAVIEAAGAERPVIVGYSEGGTVAALYAATHPERVSALVLFGAFAKLVRSNDHPKGLDPSVPALALEIIESHWGTGVSLGVFAPDLAGDENLRRWWARFERLAASPGAALRAMRLNYQADIRSVLASIAVPTLVMHRTHDAALPLELGRELAEGIPDARLEELPTGTAHWPWISQPEPVVEGVEEFLTGRRRVVQPDRALATVLFTDIVGSTQAAARLGDRQWRELLERHYATARRQIDAYGGRYVKSTGDGLLAIFDRPTAAIRCADEIIDREAQQGLDLRAGLHTGEIEVMDEDVGGMAVHIAARVAAEAGSRELLVSRTVKELAIGSGFAFPAAGRQQLKGVPDEWELFRAHT